MSDPVAIRSAQLGKQYHIGHQFTRRFRRYATLRDTLGARLQRARPPVPFSNGNGDTFWAIRDLSFEVEQGAVVGVVGRNGAGKSTLLKILSRITEPTTGYAEIHGRAGTLLEVGTGFHPELTGRENIYLSGAILGMKKAEIDRRLDEIVAFAEIEKFIDTAVKYYSSGMTVRAAFAVAAHLEPEILLVDEVLAVGDAAFQKKCLGKLGDVARQGRTVMFVSHNLGQIRRLCETGLWLHDGCCVQYGDAAAVIAAYQGKLASLTERGLPFEAGSHGAGFQSWHIRGAPPERNHALTSDESFDLVLALQLDRPLANAIHALMLQTADGSHIGGWRLNGMALRPGAYELVQHFQSLPVRPGIY